MKVGRKLEIPEQEAGQPVEEYVASAFTQIVQWMNDVRAVVNANESVVMIDPNGSTPTPAREHRGRLILLDKGGVADDELWVGILDALGNDAFKQVV